MQLLCSPYTPPIHPLHIPYTTPIQRLYSPCHKHLHFPSSRFSPQQQPSPTPTANLPSPTNHPKTALKLLTAHNRCKGTTFLANTQEITNIFLPQHQKLLNTTPTTDTTPTVEIQHYPNNHGNIKRPVTLIQLGMLLAKYGLEKEHTRKGNVWRVYQYDGEEIKNIKGVDNKGNDDEKPERVEGVEGLF
jgi:hypothetical protein